MGELSRINGIGKPSLELLEAVGITNVEELATQDVDSLFEELGSANDALAIDENAPVKSAVAGWIADAGDLCGLLPPQDTEQPAPEVRIPVDYEANPEVAEMLSRAPFAIPLPGRTMMEKGLAVADVTPGLLLNRYSGELEVRVEAKNPEPVIAAPRSSGNLERIEMKAGRRHVDTPSAKLIPALPGSGKKVPKSRSKENEDRISEIRAPREDTNRGKNPESRRFIRGVLHIHPWRMRVGAVFGLLLAINLPLAIIGAFLLLLSREYLLTFPWVREWFLAFPAALPLIGLGYFFWSVPGKCRICNQKLFVHTRAHKHIRAHHIPAIGYVFPLCVHLLLFSWFRCSACGTPVRLKK